MRRAVAPISSATLTGTVDIIPRAINARPSFAHHIPNLLDWGQGSHQIRTICRMEWDRQQVSDAPLLARLPPQQSNLGRHRAWGFAHGTGHCWSEGCFPAAPVIFYVKQTMSVH